MLFSEKLGTRLAIGWSLGALVSAGGVALSFYIDLPTGATIVATFGLALLLLAVARKLFFRSARAAQPAHHEGSGFVESLAADPPRFHQDATRTGAPAGRAD
jgi:hypothetical protein